MPADLTALGWDARRAEAFEAIGAAGLVPGRVSLEHTHIYRVWTADGELLARVAGRLRHAAGSRAEFPAVGDWVAVEPAAQGGTPASAPSCPAPAASPVAPLAIPPKSRSSRRTSTPSFWSAGSITTSTRDASSATCSSPGTAAPPR